MASVHAHPTSLLANPPSLVALCFLYHRSRSLASSESLNRAYMQAGNGDAKSGPHSINPQGQHHYSSSPYQHINSFSASSREIHDMPWMEHAEDSDMLTQSAGLDSNFLSEDALPHSHSHAYPLHSEAYDTSSSATTPGGMNYFAEEAFEALNHLSNMVRAASHTYPELLEAGGPDHAANGLLGARQQLLEWLQRYSSHSAGSAVDPLSSQYSPRAPTYKLTANHAGAHMGPSSTSTGSRRSIYNSQVSPAVTAHAGRVEREWSQSTADDFRDNSSSSWGTGSGLDIGMGDQSPRSPDDMSIPSTIAYSAHGLRQSSPSPNARHGAEDSISDTNGSFDATALMPPTKRSRYLPSSGNASYGSHPHRSTVSNPDSPSEHDSESNRAMQHANEARRASPAAGASSSSSSPHAPSTPLAHIQPFSSNNGRASNGNPSSFGSAEPAYASTRGAAPGMSSTSAPFPPGMAPAVGAFHHLGPNGQFSASPHIPAWVQDKSEPIHGHFGAAAPPYGSAQQHSPAFGAGPAFGHASFPVAPPNAPPHMLPAPGASFAHFNAVPQPFAAAPAPGELPLTMDQQLSRARQLQQQMTPAETQAATISKRSNKAAAPHPTTASYDPPIITKTVSKTGRPLPPVSMFRINPSKSTPLPQVDPNAPRTKSQQSKTPASLASMIAPGLMDSFDWKAKPTSNRKRNHAATQTTTSAVAQTPAPTFHHGQSLENAVLADFQVLNVLGTGTFGKVHLCRHKATGLYYCLKVLKKQTIFRFKQMDHIENEKQLLLQLRYPGIVQLYSTFTTKDSLVMLMEYVPGGELFYYIRRHGRLDESIARLYAAELVCTIIHLHERNIVYRDLKPENILLDSTGHLKLADFGFAKRVLHKTWTMCGTPDYLAPEIINGKGHDTAVDWWSLGVLIFEMLAGYPPFTDKDMGTLFRKIQEPEKLIIPADFSQDASDLVRRLLVADPTSRLGNIHPDIADIRTHPWFRPVHWEQIIQRTSPGPIIPVVQNPGDMAAVQEDPASEAPAPVMPIPEDVQRIFDRF